MRDILLDALTEAVTTFEGMVRTEGYATDFVEAAMNANPFEGPVTVEGIKRFGLHAMHSYTQLVQYKACLSLVTGCMAASVNHSTSPNSGLMGVCQRTLSWWSLSNSYQDIAFGSLPIIRFYRAVNRRLCPSFIMEGCQGAFGVHDGDDGAAYEEQVALQGIIRSVLYRNAIPTLTQFIIDHSEFAYQYVRNPHLYRRTLRSHAVTTSVQIMEVVLGTAVRCLGAAAVYNVLPVKSRVCGAFVAENALLLLSSLLLVRRVITPVAGRVGDKMNEWLPPTEIELLEDEKEAEEDADAYRKESDGGLSGWHKGEDSPYKVLGVNVNASKEDIKKKYKQLALQMHPDKVAHLPDADRAIMEVNFKKVASAYQILSDDDKRRIYAEESGERHSTEMLKKLERLSIYAQLPILLSVMGVLLCAMWGLGFAKFHNAFRNFTKGGVVSLRLWYG